MKYDRSWGPIEYVADWRLVIVKRLIFFVLGAFILFILTGGGSVVGITLICAFSLGMALIPILMWLYFIFRPFHRSSKLLLFRNGILVWERYYLPYLAIYKMNLNSNPYERTVEIIYRIGNGFQTYSLNVYKRHISNIDMFYEIIRPKVDIIDYNVNTRMEGAYPPFRIFYGYKFSIVGLLFVIITGLLILVPSYGLLSLINHPDYASSDYLMKNSDKLAVGNIYFVRAQIIDETSVTVIGTMTTWEEYQYTTNSGFDFSERSSYFDLPHIGLEK